MPRARKGVVQIRFEILEFLYFNPNPQPRTHIWRRATTLSYDDFKKHLTYLINKGLLLEHQEGNCSITMKGRGIYDKLRSVLSSIL
jgi:predicted transcriptional regulator